MLEKLSVMSSDDSLERTASSSGISSGIESTDLSSHILHTNASNNSVLPADSLPLSERSEASLHEISILSGQHSTSAPGLLETIQNLPNPIGDFAFGESVYSTQQESSFSTANDRNRDAYTLILDLRRFLETRSDGASIEERQLIHEVETLLNLLSNTGSQYNQENQSLSNDAEENQRSGRLSESGMDHHSLFVSDTEDSSINTSQNRALVEATTTEDHNNDVLGENIAGELIPSSSRKVNHISVDFESENIYQDTDYFLQTELFPEPLTNSNWSLQPVKERRSLFQRFLNILKAPSMIKLRNPKRKQFSIRESHAITKQNYYNRLPLSSVSNDVVSEPTYSIEGYEFLYYGYERYMNHYYRALYVVNSG